MKKLLISALTAALAMVLYRTASLSPTDGGDLAKSSDGGVVTMTTSASHPVVLAGRAQDVYLHLSLDAAELTITERPSMNLALVIDRSGSMGSERKLEFARSAAEQLIGRLEPEDHLAIVVYDDEVRTLVPSTSAAQRDVFLAAIRGLAPGNSTNLHGGMMGGYEEVLQHMDEWRSNRVLLISDGLANAGVTDRDEIRARAERCRARGVRISTMGMGISYDEELMSGIATGAGGNYYYVDHAESVGRHLDREIDELSKQVARDLVVSLELGKNVEVRDVYGYPHRMVGRTVRIPVQDVFSGEHKKVVLRLRVRGIAGEEGTLAKATLRYRDVSTHESHETPPTTLRQRFSDDIGEVRRSKRIDILIQSEVVHNAEAILAAMDLQKGGDLEAARELLEARYRGCKLLNDTEYRSDELSRMLNRMQQILLDLEQTWENPWARRDLQLGCELEALGYLGN